MRFMNFFLSEGLQEEIIGSRVYLDNDFLGEMYYDRDLLTSFLSLTADKASLVIDPLTKFEFLRSVFLDVQNRETFLSQPLFLPATNHQEVFIKIQDNALTLSKIYAHNHSGLHASTIDLFLAGRVMLDPSNVTKIISANKSDFPDCVFDVAGILSKITNGNSVQSYCLMQFNQDKFDTAIKKLEKLAN